MRIKWCVREKHLDAKCRIRIIAVYSWSAIAYIQLLNSAPPNCGGTIRHKSAIIHRIQNAFTTPFHQPNPLRLPLPLNLKIIQLYGVQSPLSRLGPLRAMIHHQHHRAFRNRSVGIMRMVLCIVIPTIVMLISIVLSVGQCSIIVHPTRSSMSGC